MNPWYRAVDKPSKKCSCKRMRGVHPSSRYMPACIYSPQLCSPRSLVAVTPRAVSTPRAQTFTSQSPGSQSQGLRRNVQSESWGRRTHDEPGFSVMSERKDLPGDGCGSVDTATECFHPRSGGTALRVPRGVPGRQQAAICPSKGLAN